VLTRIDDAIWTIAAPQRFLGLHLGTRMTVVAVRGGGLLLHSPIEPTAALRAEIDALGPVRHVVCPNLFHHLHAAPWMSAYPDAVLHGPRGLAKKCPDLPAMCLLSETPHPDWKDDLVPLFIAGCDLRETLFVHPGSRTLISADLTENFETSDHLPTRLYLKAAGIHGKIGFSRMLRFVYRDHAAARESIERLLAHDFDRVSVAHGRVIERAGKDAVRDTFAWL
jgi:Domain of unknown function (DUF4336)